MTNWTTPRTWVTGETVTASQLNTHLRDNLNELRAAKICRVYRSTSQAFANATRATINFDAESTDPEGWHSTTSNTDRITPDIPGWYTVLAGISFSPSNVGWRELILWRNGLSGQAFSTIGRGVACTGTESTNWMLSGTFYANGSTDYFSVSAEQNSGGSLNVAAGEFTSWMSVQFMGA